MLPTQRYTTFVTSRAGSKEHAALAQHSKNLPIHRCLSSSCCHPSDECSPRRRSTSSPGGGRAGMATQQSSLAWRKQSTRKPTGRNGYLPHRKVSRQTHKRIPLAKDPLRKVIQMLPSPATTGAASISSRSERIAPGLSTRPRFSKCATKTGRMTLPWPSGATGPPAPLAAAPQAICAKAGPKPRGSSPTRCPAAARNPP
mmetsp:Transcript_98468/g.234426  ORF Transcript_98468/g.234426 Transcript_98468/m.234426 type:complete len:200 (+) Transcript_98468:924-1523(+)